MRNLIIAIIIVGIAGVLVRVLPARQSAQPITVLQTPTASPVPLRGIGQVTRHVAGFIGTAIRVQGYMLALEKTYAIFSDESGGPIGVYDLPVSGPGVGDLHFKQKYILLGTFVYGGLQASNQNAYHLELSQPPQPTP